MIYGIPLAILDDPICLDVHPLATQFVYTGREPKASDILERVEPRKPIASLQ
jgi:hypothetical protein